MPWTKSNYPDSMKNLPVKVRNKAVEIGNALLEERHMDEGIAIATAISRAKDWAVDHGEPAESPGKKKRTTDVKKHGEDRYVVPAEKGWAVKNEGSQKIEKEFKSKKDAEALATKEAKEANASLTVQKKNGRIDKKISYNPNNKGSKQK